MIIGNLNPEGIMCDFNTNPYNTRIVNFNHAMEGPHVLIRHRIHKLNLQRITKTDDHASVTY